ncbi:MAG: transposase [Candidatus Competibacteraceae bacterium]|nr:transposase [Candidatus Competibacteraceae bacterium]
MRRQFKDHEEFKRLKWVLLKNAEDLSEEQKKKLALAFLIAPQLKNVLRTERKIPFNFQSASD